MITDIKEGSMSEWNEGNFKNLRLHEAQELINFAKISPLRISLDGKGWNYQLWVAGIDILFGEGKSKYAEKEITSINKIKTLINLRLRFRTPHKIVYESNLNGKKERAIVDNENWESLKNLVELYEQEVKFYNDKHGLSTRNRTTEGLF